MAGAANRKAGALTLTVRIANYATGDNVGMDISLPSGLSKLTVDDITPDRTDLEILLKRAIEKFKLDQPKDTA